MRQNMCMYNRVFVEGFMQAHEKCAMKKEEEEMEKNDTCLIFYILKVLILKRWAV